MVDLGSGDGLIPLTAARMNATPAGPRRRHQSQARQRSPTTSAKREGLADRVSFEHQNAFDVDLRDATVVTMWLFPELMRLLRPVILERARPGTRDPYEYVGARQLATRQGQQRWHVNLHVDRSGACGRQLGLGSDAGGTAIPAGALSLSSIFRSVEGVVRCWRSP